MLKKGKHAMTVNQRCKRNYCCNLIDEDIDMLFRIQSTDE